MTHVEKGQIWHANSGRRVVVEAVRCIKSPFRAAYVLCHEVTESGRRASGLSKLGLPRGRAFRSMVRWVDGVPTMGHGYTYDEAERPNAEVAPVVGGSLGGGL